MQLVLSQYFAVDALTDWDTSSRLGRRRCTDSPPSSHKVEELGSRVAKEAEIIHEKEDGNEDEKGGGGDNDVREPCLEEAHKVRDVKTPKQRGKPTTLSEALEKGGEGIVCRVVTMEDPNFDREMKGTEMLPDDIRNAIVSEDKQQLLTKDARESQRNVPKEDVRGTAEGTLAVEDIGDEGISGIEGLLLFERETEHLWLRQLMHGIGGRDPPLARAWDGNTQRERESVYSRGKPSTCG